MIVTLTMHVLVILRKMCVCYMVTCIQLSMTPAGVIYTCVRVYILMNIIYSYSSGFIYSVYSSTVFNPVLRIFSWLLWNGISGELWWVTMYSSSTNNGTYGNIWKQSNNGIGGESWWWVTIVTVCQTAAGKWYHNGNYHNNSYKVGRDFSGRVINVDNARKYHYSLIVS